MWTVTYYIISTLLITYVHNKCHMSFFIQHIFCDRFLWLSKNANYWYCSDAGSWNFFGVPVVIGGHNLPSPDWNRINWSAKYWGGPPPVPASLYWYCNIYVTNRGKTTEQTNSWKIRIVIYKEYVKSMEKEPLKFFGVYFSVCWWPRRALRSSTFLPEKNVLSDLFIL